MDILNSILDNIDEAIIITDRKGEILFFNQEAEYLSNSFNRVPLKEGENIASYVSDSRRQNVAAILKEVSEHKSNVSASAEYTGINGLILHLELKYIPVLDDDEKLSYISVVCKDISSHKAFERKIKAQATNLESLIQKANAVIISTDSRGYVTTWNDHCTAITGFKTNEVYARRLSDVVLPESERKSFATLIDRVLNLESVSNYETNICTKDGRILTCLLSATPQLTSTGHAIGITFVGQDITELIEYRRTLEEKIEERTAELRLALQKEKELVEMKSRFVSIASHEFRTPLSSILFATNFLKDYHSRIYEHQRNAKLDNIVSHVSHMTSMLDDVLNYGKSSTGTVNLSTAVVKVKDFVFKICEEATHSAKGSHLVIQEIQNAPAEIVTDERLLRSILSNLITNAIKFSPGKEKVIVSIAEVGDHVEISVKDEGIGIPKDELDNIFEPFLRGKNAESIPGTGLGLSITKNAVELLKGKLHAESQLDSGTVFKVLIPRSL